MGFPAAKLGDKILAVDIHLILPPGVPTPIPVPHPFAGTIDGNLSTVVTINGKPAATIITGSPVRFEESLCPSPPPIPACTLTKSIADRAS